MATTRFPGDVSIEGDLTLGGTLKPLQTRANLVQDAVQAYELPLTDFRVWDAYGTALGTAGNDDLGIAAGAFATGLPYLTSGDCKVLTATRYARITFTLPPEYEAGQTVQIRFAAGQLTTIADTTATIDVEAYSSNRDTLKTGSDLVSTAAQSIRSLTFAEKTFDVTSASLAPGSVLDLRIAIAIVDGATGTAVIGAIAHAEVLLDVKG